MKGVRKLIVGRSIATMRFSPAPSFRSAGRRFASMRFPSPPSSRTPRTGCRSFSLAQKARFFGKNVRRLYPLNRFNSTSPRSPGTVENVSSKDGRSKEAKFTDALNEDGREQLTLNEFITLSLRFGFDTNSIERLRGDLVQKGTIMDFGEELETIVIKPERVKKAWDHALDLDGTHTSEFISRRKVELEALRQEIEPLEVQLEKIDHKSERSAVWCMRGLFGYTIAHTWLIAYLTFWLLSWDIMEPITYLVNLYTFVIAVYFFNSTNCDFTFDAMKDTLKAIKRKKLFHDLKFDEEEYDRLKREIYLVEQDLYNPEWFVLNEVAQEEAGTVMQDPVHVAEQS